MDPANLTKLKVSREMAVQIITASVIASYHKQRMHFHDTKSIEGNKDELEAALKQIFKLKKDSLEYKANPQTVASKGKQAKACILSMFDFRSEG